MRTRTLLIGLLVAAIATVSAVAATQSGPRKTASAPKTPPVPLLWKVSDGDNELYLLGSFHLLKPGDYPLSHDVDLAFDDAESLVFELSPAEMSSPALAQAMAQAALRTDGKPLSHELPEPMLLQLQAWTKANAATLDAMGLHGDMLLAFDAWFVGLTISIIEMRKQGLDPEQGLDKHFMTRAEKAGKAAVGLEKGREQIAIFDGMSKVEQLQFLEEALSEAHKAGTEIERLHRAWRQGDAAQLWQSLAVEMRDKHPKLYQRINVARNDAWVPKLQAMLDRPGTDDTLVVVGTLHLLGDDGVVEKLRAKGYRVERVCTGCPPEAPVGSAAKPAGAKPSGAKPAGAKPAAGRQH
jgi:uncharacterized protein YbaP (TraB family)